MKLATTKKGNGIKFISWTAIACIQVIFLMAFSIGSTFGQRPSSDPNYQPQQKTVPAKVEINQTLPVSSNAVNPAVDQSPVTDLPFYNYKGISDLEQAKAAWVADFPEEYKKLVSPKTSESKNVIAVPQQNIQRNPATNTGTSPSGIGTKSGSQIQSSSVTVTTGNQVPSAKQMLPKDYDDSKSNIEKK